MPSVVVRRAGLAELGLEHEAVLGRVALAGAETRADLGPLAVPPADLNRPRLEHVPHLEEYHRPIPEHLQRARLHRDRDGHLVDDHLAAHEQPWAPLAAGARQVAPGQTGV